MKTFNKRSNVVLGLGIILSIFLISSTAIPAKTSSKGLPAMEAGLEEARKLLDNENLDQTKLRQVIADLEKQQPQHPNDIRYPLYLAEAYYRLADPEADVNREYPMYEKTEKYAKEALALRSEQGRSTLLERPVST